MDNRGGNQHKYQHRQWQALWLVLLGMFMPGLIVAQLTMSISTPVLDEYPVVKIPIQLKDNSAVVQSLSASYFTITENDHQYDPLYLDCATDTIWETLSLFFVLDVSGSMEYQFGTKVADPTLEKWNAAKTAIATAIDLMRIYDGAALYAFHKTCDLIVPFTTDKAQLKSGLDTLTFKNNTQIYDAIWRVLNDADTISGRRAIILITDGKDWLSAVKYPEVIDKAQQMGIPVYIIGLDVDPHDTQDIETIARETGGQYRYAPTAQELQIVMMNIAETILAKDCILAYRSKDTCMDGATRNVEIEANIPPYVESMKTSYSLPFVANPMNIYIGETGKEYEHEKCYSFPVNVSGRLFGDRDMRISIEVEYDHDILEFDSLDGAMGIAAIGNLKVYPRGDSAILIAGNRLELNDDVFADEIKTLFGISFYVKSQVTVVPSEISINNAQLAQHCPIQPYVKTVPFTVLGCKDISMGIEGPLIGLAGAELRIPVRLGTELNSTQEYEYDFDMLYDADVLRYSGFETKGTVSESMSVQIGETTPGTLHITGNRGFPSQTTGDIVQLIFNVAHITESQTTMMTFDDVHMMQTCMPGIEVFNANILIDGDCEKLTRRRSFYLDQSAPNPVQNVNGSPVLLSFSVGGTDSQSLRVFDMEGKPVATIFEGMLPKGKHTMTYVPESLAPGIYLIVLREGDNLWTRKMVVTR